jgi:hypothetical protein
MSLTLEPFTTWIDRKRREIAAEEPLSIQANIAALSQRLWKAEQTIEQVRRFIDKGREDRGWGHDDDFDTGWDQLANNILRILDGGGTDA